MSILGGAKISGKIDVVSALLPRVDRLLIRVSGGRRRRQGEEPERARRSLDLAANATAAMGGRLLVPESDDEDFRLALPQPLRAAD